MDLEAPSYQLPASGRGAEAAAAWKLEASRSFPDDIINNTVFLALVGPHDVIPLGIVLNPLQGLAGVLGQNLVQPFAGAQELTGVDVDVGGLPPGPGPRAGESGYAS
jgi:hypothetical protein